jgi:hypothetical protein
VVSEAGLIPPLKVEAQRKSRFGGRVMGMCSQVQGAGCMVQGAGCMVQGEVVLQVLHSAARN